jgi:uncharacterized protein DUF4242
MLSAWDREPSPARPPAGGPAGRLLNAIPLLTQEIGGEGMPRYLVQRTFPDGLHLPVTEEGANAWGDVVARNADLGVTWVHSYVSADRTTSYCLYDAPDPEAIRKAAARNGLPVDAITQVAVLDPYCYR